jgi:hypothetical protein
MSAPIDTKLWAKIKAAYMADTSQTNGSVAKRFKVSKSAVDKRSAAEGWKAQREAQSIAVDAIASEVSEELSKPIPAKSVRVALQEMDRNEIFDAAIAQLHAAAPDAGIKSQEAAYGQLIKIIQVQQQMEHQRQMFKIEHKLKEIELALKERQLNPPTEREWAEWAIHWGYDMKVLWDALKEVAGC